MMVWRKTSNTHSLTPFMLDDQHTIRQALPLLAIKVVVFDRVNIYSLVDLNKRCSIYKRLKQLSLTERVGSTGRSSHLPPGTKRVRASEGSGCENNGGIHFLMLSGRGPYQFFLPPQNIQNIPCLNNMTLP